MYHSRQVLDGVICKARDRWKELVEPCSVALGTDIPQRLYIYRSLLARGKTSDNKGVVDGGI